VPIGPEDIEYAADISRRFAAQKAKILSQL
jgi:hypothetical protein